MRSWGGCRREPFAIGPGEAARRAFCGNLLRCRAVTKLSVIVFAQNEAANVAPVLQELTGWLRSQPYTSEVTFVDDGSTDGTAGAASEALADFPHIVRRHPVNRGIGAAIKTGVAASRGAFATFLPADGQIAPEALAALMAPADRGAEIVLSVYRRRSDGLHRALASAGLRALILAVHGVRLRSEGPYLFRRELFDPSQLLSDSFFLNFEFPIRAKAAGLRIETVVIDCRARRAGASKSFRLAKVRTVATELVVLRYRRIAEAVAQLAGT